MPRFPPHSLPTENRSADGALLRPTLAPMLFACSRKASVSLLESPVADRSPASVRTRELRLPVVRPARRDSADPAAPQFAHQSYRPCKTARLPSQAPPAPAERRFHRSPDTDLLLRNSARTTLPPPRCECPPR